MIERILHNARSTYRKGRLLAAFFVPNEIVFLSGLFRRFDLGISDNI